MEQDGIQSSRLADTSTVFASTPSDSSGETTTNPTSPTVQSVSTQNDKTDEEYRKELTYWVDRFILRFQLKLTKFVGESADADEEVCAHWISTMYQRIAAAYPPECIWNADETGLFYDQLPRVTYSTSTQQSGGKISKLRVSVLLASSQTGEKRRPLIIGSHNSLLRINTMEPRPYDYRIQENKWMTAEIFEEWLGEWNRQLKSENKCIALIVDNCYSHKLVSRHSNIALFYLPPCQTALLQPMDQGIIRSFKSLYRQLLVQFKCRDTKQSRRANYIRPRLYGRMICQAWKQVRSTVIVHCFEAAGWRRMEEDSSGSSVQVPSEELLADVTDIEETVLRSVRADLESATQTSIKSINLVLPDEDEFAVQPFDRSELSVVEHVVQNKYQEEESETIGSSSLSGNSIRSSVATLLNLSDSLKDSERKRIFKGILHSIQTTEHHKHRKYTQPTLFHYSSHG